MIGLGERAGSGMAKIQRGWQQTGGTLSLVDSFEPFDQTRLEMEFALPKESTQSVRRVSGKMSRKTSGKVSRSFWN
jgi:hypothetical protein